VRLLLPRSGYAPQQKSGPQEVGLTAEGDNDALGGLFLAGWSVLHGLRGTPPSPGSQVGRQHAHDEAILPALNTHHVAAGFAMSAVTQPCATVVTVRHALTVAAAKGVVTKRP